MSTLVQRHFSTMATCAGILGALGYVGRQAELAEALGDIREQLAAAEAERDEWKRRYAELSAALERAALRAGGG